MRENTERMTHTHTDQTESSDRWKCKSETHNRPSMCVSWCRNIHLCHAILFINKHSGRFLFVSSVSFRSIFRSTFGCDRNMFRVDPSKCYTKKNFGVDRLPRVLSDRWIRLFLGVAVRTHEIQVKNRNLRISKKLGQIMERKKTNDNNMLHRGSEKSK